MEELVWVHNVSSLSHAKFPGKKKKKNEPEFLPDRLLSNGPQLYLTRHTVLPYTEVAYIGGYLTALYHLAKSNTSGQTGKGHFFTAAATASARTIIGLEKATAPPSHRQLSGNNHTSKALQRSTRWVHG